MRWSSSSSEIARARISCSERLSKLRIDLEIVLDRSGWQLKAKAFHRKGREGRKGRSKPTAAAQKRSERRREKQNLKPERKIHFCLSAYSLRLSAPLEGVKGTV